MWLYNAAALFTAFTFLVSCDNLQQPKQSSSHTSGALSNRQNTISTVDEDEVQIPLKIPKLSRGQKIALIIESGQNPFERKRNRKEKGKKRPRKPRDVRHYASNPYLLLDHSSEEESAKYRIATGSSDVLRNKGLRTDTEETKLLTEAAWQASGSNYWEVSKSGYQNTSTVQHREEMMPTYSNVSASSYLQRSMDGRRFWGRNMKALSTTTVKSAATHTTVVTTSAPPANSLASDITDGFFWEQLLIMTPSPKLHQPIPLPMKTCPRRFDAVTRAFNGRTYVFARDRVYQLWRRDNLHQKASFSLQEMFPNGPRTVTVAYTNTRSGVTVLIEHRTVYRYRWNRKKKAFYLARKSPQTLTKKISAYPRAGFQWVDGNQVLIDGDNFVTYDAYWNIATFYGLTANYFPQFPNDLIGLTYQNDTFFILYTASNKIQIYDTEKYRVIQEYPIQISEFVGCFNV